MNIELGNFVKTNRGKIYKVKERVLKSWMANYSICLCIIINNTPYDVKNLTPGLAPLNRGKIKGTYITKVANTKEDLK